MQERHPKDYKEYVLESEYKNSHTPVKMYHRVCSNHFNITPNSFICGIS